MGGRSMSAAMSLSESFERFIRDDVEQSIPERFEQQVSKYPDRIAVKTDRHELTYAALNQAANRVAHAILAQNGKEGETVALFLEQDGPSMAAILGVLKAGRMCISVETSHPEARAAQILEDAQTNLIVTDKKNLATARLLARDSRQLIDVDEIDSQTPAENPGLTMPPNAFAYMHYTSGSTGQPKGVVQNHRNILRMVRSFTNGIYICADDRISLYASANTGLGMTIIFTTLLNGAALHLINIREQGVANLATWLITEEITIHTSAPSTFRHVMKTIAEEKFPKIRVLIVGGETVRKSDVELYKEHFSPRCTFVHVLASSETGPFTHYYIDKQTEITGNIVPVGYALEDMEVLLLDEAGGEVRRGSVGEIAVKSRYLSPGYWRDPDRTRAAFLPVRGSDDERIYRTGDLGLVRADGCLEHLGRKDFQVKIRGFRVELEEIEEVLGKHPAVQETVVAVSKDVTGENSLVAYVVPASEQAPTTGELRGYLRENLPEYMVPSAFVTLDALPFTPMGKVDRQALPASEQARPESEASYEAPRTRVEETLAKIWEEVLGIERVGVHDDFFELGGHSLLAASLFARIEQTFDQQLPLSTLFQAPTVGQLADVLRRRGEAAPQTSLVKIQPNGSRPPFFCAHGARGEVLFLRSLAKHLGPDQPFYAFRRVGDKTEVRSIEDYAASYIRELREVQPEGPYFLGGHSGGGVVAFEMAQQLRAQGQEVALVALLDTVGPARIAEARERQYKRERRKLLSWRLHSWLRQGVRGLRGLSPLRHVRRAKRKTRKLIPRGLRARLHYHVSSSWSLGPLRHIRGVIGRKTRLAAYKISLLFGSSVPRTRSDAYLDEDLTKKRDLEARRKARQSLREARKSHGEARKSDRRARKAFRRELLESFKTASESFKASGEAYKARPYPGRVTLFRAADEPNHADDPYLGWERVVVKGLEVREVPGEHGTFSKEPHVKVLAAELKACLDRARTNRW